MTQVKLGSDRWSMRLGFGCGPLHGSLQSRQSRRVLDLAFEAGFRHFDVAPSYGLGLAETELGRALQGRRQRVTLTTKAGLARPQRGLLLSAVRSLVKPVIAALPGFKHVSQAIQRTTVPARCFDARSVEASLLESLARLQTSYVDIFLMHEMRLEDATPELVDMLLAYQRAGAIGALGTGTSIEDAAAITNVTPALGAVQQHRWNVFEPRLEPSQALRITHGAVAPAFGKLTALISTRSSLRIAWSAALDLDLAAPNMLSDLLLGAALAANRNGFVLVHSHRADRIRRFVTVAEDCTWQTKGALFADLVARVALASFDRSASTSA